MKKSTAAPVQAPAPAHFDKHTYDIEYKKRNIVEKRVPFNRLQPDDMALLSWAESRPANFTQYIKSLIQDDMRKAEP